MPVPSWLSPRDNSLTSWMYDPVWGFGARPQPMQTPPPLQQPGPVQGSRPGPWTAPGGGRFAQSDLEAAYGGSDPLNSFTNQPANVQGYGGLGGQGFGSLGAGPFAPAQEQTGFAGGPGGFDSGEDWGAENEGRVQGTPQYYPNVPFAQEMGGAQQYAAAQQQGGGQQYADPYSQLGSVDFNQFGNPPFLKGGGFGRGFQPGLAGKALLGGVSNAFNQAKNANEYRYNKILKGYEGTINQYESGLGGLLQGYENRYNRGINSLDAMQASEQNAINERGLQQKGKATQGLVSAGLSNTSVAPNVNRGIEQDANKASGYLAGQFASLKGQLGGQLSGDLLSAYGQGLGNIVGLRKGALDFQERRNDVGPDPRTVMSAMGQYGAGMGGFQNANMLANQRGYSY